MASQARENFAKKILGWGGNAEKMRVCFLFFKINLFIYLFIFGCIGSSLLRVVVASRDYSLLQVRGLLIVVASLVAEYGP